MILLTACNQTSDHVDPGTVIIANGQLEGFVDEATGITSFLGIPYAAPPVGDLRWKAPQPVEDWAGALSVKQFGDRPMQVKMWDDLAYRSEQINEDCLYLNVWTPTTKPEEALPVLVYIHGGGLIAGDGSEKRYDGASMAQKGMVVVTINYRLNIFGFFAHPELSQEASYNSSGNYGYLDQVASLEWVNKNIAAFGGDPNRVTIAGESAGSVSVAAHMASPLSKHLIAGAIGESGAPIKPTLFPVPLADAEQQGIDYGRLIGKSNLTELREMSAEDLFETYKNQNGPARFPTVIDGHFLPKSFVEICEAGEQAQIPLLVGWNSAEIPGGAFMQGEPYEAAAFIEKIKVMFPDDWKEALELYPHGSTEEIELSATALASDNFIAYSTYKWFDLQRKHSDQPVYRYLYSKLRPQLVRDSLNTNWKPGVGAPHACEIEYCMGNLHLLINR